MTSPAARLGAIGATAALYFVAAKLGLSMALVAAQVTAVWPPTGIALVVALVYPEAWPGIALGAFLANVTTQETVPAALGIATGNTLEALFAGWGLRRLGFRPALDRLRDVVELAVVSAGASTALSATLGVVSLCLGGIQPWAAFSSLWSVWWIGDALGALIVAPVLLVWTTTPRVPLEKERFGEAAALFAGAIAVTLSVFVGEVGAPGALYPLQYTVFPFLVWSALRFGQRGTTTLIFWVSTIAIWSTVRGWGPFARAGAHESLLLLQLFMAVVAVTGMLLAAAISERDFLARQRREAYERLQIGEARLRLALEAGIMGVWDWEVGSGAVEWSDNLETIHGLAPGTFPRTIEGFRALVHPDDQDLVNGAIEGALAGKSRYEVEFRNVRPDGSFRWLATRGLVVRDLTGRPIRMIGVASDVTERRGLEEELTRRAAALADTDRRKDEFLAMLAHELRNPLAPLGTALHLLRVDAPDPGRFLDMADRQLKHLVRLVDDLLDVSRITQGRITLRKERVLLADVVSRAVEMMRPLNDSRGHTVTVSLPPAPVELEADAGRLTQVLGNLLGNAAKYTPPGGSVWVTAERVADDVVVRVRDTGIGLPPELLPHIFDLFVQADESLDRTSGGLGIGLTVVRRLVELHGGRVEARSGGLGQGSEFLVYLPAVHASGVVAEEAPPPAAPARISRPLRVLVVEDNHDAAHGLAAVLQLWGHEVEVAFDGLAALELAERSEPDVILSDLGLPGMDGYELARRLRAEPSFGGVVLVALSGYGQEEDKRRALDAGFDHHLVKPPDLAHLEELLGRAISVAERRPRTLH